MLEPRNDVSADALPASTPLTVWSAAAEGSSVGGDWCEAVEITPDVVALTIGDVSGHGDGAAELMGGIRRSVLHALKFMRDPSDVLAAANAYIANRADAQMATAIVAFYDRTRRTLCYANAGHPPLLLIGRNSASFLTHARADIPIGILARHSAQVYTIAVPPRALVVFYTDGVTERDRDPIRGERDLAEAAMLAFGRFDGDYARAIADTVFAAGRGRDDAAVIVLDSATAGQRRGSHPRRHPSRDVAVS